MPRLCSRFEAGPASPSWQLRDSSRFVTRLRSKSSGWISSSVCPEPPFVGGQSADRRGGLLSKSAFSEFCREKVNISIVDGWTSPACLRQRVQAEIRMWRTVLPNKRNEKNMFTVTLKLCPILVPISSSSIWSMYLLRPLRVSVPLDVPSSCSSSLSSLVSSSRSSESNSSSLFPVKNEISLMW